MTGGHTPESLHERLTAYVQHRREAVRQAQHISDVVRASELSDFSTSELDTGIRAQTYMLDELEQLLAGEDVEVVRAGTPTQEQEKERG